ncbi:hypothetical protein [Actinomyces oricola]|uniref:hypothetical protein n=1 Tax=Actinomyces oricola TaxID=206043 RepID=UPI000FFF6292|nr:hypothetical protein [Actinomyces oricola]
MLRLLPVDEPLDEVEEAESAVRVYRFALPEIDPEGRWVATADDEGLRDAIVGAVAQDWAGGEDVGVVCRSLDRAVERQLSGAVRDGIRFARLSRDEAKADTMSSAWEVLRLETRRVVMADRPWAMWTALTRREARRGRDEGLPDGVSVSTVDPALLTDGGVDLPGAVVRRSVVALDDFETVLSGVVAALVGAGMSETIAWAGTRRVAELSLRGASRRHTLAGEDPRLEDLGASPACARAWMTLLVGSRRGAQVPVVQMSEDELAMGACRVARAYSKRE